MTWDTLIFGGLKKDNVICGQDQICLNIIKYLDRV